MKFQAIIDAALSVQDVRRAPQAPSVSFKQNEQAFQDRAAKIEALRAACLAGQSISATAVFEVVRYRGHWRTLHNGQRSTPFADQRAAILAAKKLARLKLGGGRSAEVILRRVDGESVIQTIDNDECCSSN